MSAAEHGPTASEYIVHHLQHLQNVQQKAIVDFSVINFDSLIVAGLLGIIALVLLLTAARKATSGVPGRFQAAVEILVEMVDNEANGGEAHHAFLRIVPTADLSTTLGLAFAVLLLRFWYSIKIKGAGGWAHELVSAPFGTSKNPIFALVLGVINLLMQIIEYVANTVSHGMRLFGNMYAGELVFMLIALMGGAAALSLSGVLLPVGHIIAGTIWTLFHILVITLQAFIFMMLALIYLGQAHNAH